MAGREGCGDVAFLRGEDGFGATGDAATLTGIAAASAPFSFSAGGGGCPEDALFAEPLRFCSLRNRAGGSAEASEAGAPSSSSSAKGVIFLFAYASRGKTLCGALQ